jgi:hypothetical protein
VLQLLVTANVDALHFDDDADTFPQNVGPYKSHTVSHPRRWHSWKTLCSVHWQWIIWYSVFCTAQLIDNDFSNVHKDYWWFLNKTSSEPFFIVTAVKTSNLTKLPPTSVHLQSKPVHFPAVSCLLYFSTLQIKAIWSSWQPLSDLHDITTKKTAWGMTIWFLEWPHNIAGVLSQANSYIQAPLDMFQVVFTWATDPMSCPLPSSTGRSMCAWYTPGRNISDKNKEQPIISKVYVKFGKMAT